VGYGRAEALLERKWPQKYNAAGHLVWAGRVYGKGLTRPLGRQGRIYHGTWGAAPFQRLYRSAPGMLGALPLMPEWWLVVAALAALTGLGVHWTPLLLALPLFCLAIGIPVVQAGVSAAQAPFTCVSRFRALKLRFLTALLHLVQPLARLHGRLRHGLTPWRRRNGRSLAFPRVRRSRIWSERWRAPVATLEAVEVALHGHGVCVMRGGDFDRWDLDVRGGLLGGARTRMTVEEHGAGRQLIRFRSWPRVSVFGLALVLIFGGLSTAAAIDGARAAFAILAALALLVTVGALWEGASSLGAILGSIDDGARGEVAAGRPGTGAAPADDAAA